MPRGDGKQGNYQVVGSCDSSRVLEDDGKPAAITLTLVADVPEVDGTTLDLSRFKAHLDHAELADTPLYKPHAHNRSNVPIACRPRRISRAQPADGAPTTAKSFFKDSTVWR
jgi:hypothetical protein